RKTADFRVDGTLSSTEQLALSHDLDHLATNIAMAMRDRQFTDPDVDVKQALLERRINQGVTSGRIDAREAQQLRQELNRIAAMKANYSSSGRGLNAEQKLSIAIELERLSARLDLYLPTAVSALPGIDEKQEEIARKILDAQSSGGLTSQALNELEYEFNRIAQVEKTYRADGNLSEAETLDLARDLDNLSARVDRSVGALAGPGPGHGPGAGTGHGPGAGAGYGPGAGAGYGPEAGTGYGPRPGRAVRVLKAEVQKMILDGLASGRLPVQAGSDLNRELDRIAARESEFRSDGALSDSEAGTLTTDLEALRARVDHDLSPLPNIEGRRQEIVAKIDSSLASGRLAAQAASELRQDLDRVASLETTFKSSEGRLDDQEMNTLDREYALVLSHLDRSQAPLPDVAGFKAQIERKINDGVASGKIASQQMTDFQQELDRIASVEQSFRASD